MSDDDRRCGNCCNWRADHDGETYALCELVNQVRPAHGGTACPSHNVDVAGLREEVERLRAASANAGRFLDNAVVVYADWEMNRVMIGTSECAYEMASAIRQARASLSPAPDDAKEAK